ncbi:MAG TPA: tryptophan 7-halogenase, partial [Cellvibrio sp.]
TSSRTDTEYWRANTADQQDISPVMRELYSAWFAGKDLATEVARLNIGAYYPAPSWYCIFSGMGILPDAAHVRAPSADEARFDLKALDEFLRRCTLNFSDHRAVLNNLASARRE